MKVVSIVGARPEFVQAAPVSRALRPRHHEVLVHTGQHYDYEMDRIFFEELGLKHPKYQLGVGSDSDVRQTQKMSVLIENILKKEKPDATIVYGDTNSTLSGALTSAKLTIPVIHIEAGCRSFDMTVPEEVNRICSDHISRLLFPPDRVAYDNLIKEGIEKSKIFLCGNTLIDACVENYKIAKSKSKIKRTLRIERDYAVLTLHRSGNVDNKERLRRLLKIVSDIDMPIVFPVHPRTKKMVKKFGLSALLKNFIVTKPLGYIDFLALMGGSKAVFTDSGGVQVEANIIGRPCIVLRDTTEWVQETKGMSFVVSDDKKLIMTACRKVERGELRRLDYSKHKGSSKRIIDTCVKLNKKSPLEVWKRPIVK